MFQRLHLATFGCSSFQFSAPSGWNLLQQKLSICKFCFQEVFAIRSLRSLHPILIALRDQRCCIYWLYCDALYLVWDCMKLFPAMDVFKFMCYVVSKPAAASRPSRRLMWELVLHWLVFINWHCICNILWIALSKFELEVKKAGFFLRAY